MVFDFQGIGKEWKDLETMGILLGVAPWEKANDLFP